MHVTKVLKVALHWTWRLPVCALAYVVGTMVGGAVVGALGMALPQMPEEADERIMGVCLAIASVVLAAGTAPLARGLRGSFWSRWLILAGLCYVCLGINTPIEAAIFTNLGGMSGIVVLTVFPCAFFGAATALLFRPVRKVGSPAGASGESRPGHGPRWWAWRLAVAVCVFPAVYWVFGMMVGPFVVEYYKAGDYDLTLPGVGTIILVQFLRSALFLAAALPVLMRWGGSRFGLALRLGVAFYVLVGLFGLIQGYWLAPTLRVLHNVEILADSMVYALALCWLFAGTERAKRAVSLSDPFVSLQHA